MARILLIDDHSALCDLLVTLLTARGHAVQVAPDGAQGLHIFSTLRPDLVVTDLNMPGLDGLEIITALKRAHPETPVIVMSGGFGPDTDLYLEIASELGADAVLGKPFQLAGFMRAVDQALAGRHPAKSSTEPFALLPALAAG